MKLDQNLGTEQQYSLKHITRKINVCLFYIYIIICSASIDISKAIFQFKSLSGGLLLVLLIKDLNC